MNSPDSSSALSAVQALAGQTRIDAYERAAADWHVLLWSQSQNAFHIEPHQRMLESNRRAYADNRRMDYIPIFIGTSDSCSEIAEKIRGTIRMRHADRARLGGV